MLKRYAFKKQSIPFQVNVDRRQLPNRWAHLLLFESKRAALLQSPQEAPAEGHVVNKVTLYLQMRSSPIIHHQVAVMLLNTRALARWWIKVAPVRNE